MNKISEEEVFEETQDDTTTETIEESEENNYPKLYIKMSEGGSVRINNATYYVDGKFKIGLILIQDGYINIIMLERSLKRN